MGCLILVAMSLILLRTFGVNLDPFYQFISNIWTGFWDGFNAVFLVILGFFRNIFSIFDFIGDAFEWLLINLGKLLEPVLSAIPDSPIIPLVALVILGTLSFMLKKPGDELKKDDIDPFVKRMYACCAAAVNLGMLVAGTGNPLGSISGIIISNASTPPMTLANYAEWSGFARNMMTICVVFGLYASIAFGASKGPRAFIRTWVGLGFCGMLGYMYMTIRLPVSHWLVDNLSFIGELINFPIGLFEFFVIMQVFFGFVALVVPVSVFKAFNEMTESKTTPAKTKNSSDNVDASDGSKLKDFHFPDRVLDDQGNTWEIVDSDSEKAEYRSRKTGARKTVWATGGYLDLPSGWRAG